MSQQRQPTPSTAGSISSRGSSNARKLGFRERMQALVENQLEGQRLLTTLGARFPSAHPTAAEVQTMSVSSMQQHPAIWEAYVRGWQGCVACMPPPPMPRASALATWPALPAFRAQTPRQPTVRQQPTSRPMLQPPTPRLPAPRPPAPARSAGVAKTRPKARAIANSTTDKALDTVSVAKRKSMERLSKYRQTKRHQMRQRIRESQGTTSQQFRLAKHGEALDSPAAIPTTGPPASETPGTPPRDEEQPMETEEPIADDLDEEINTFLLQEQESPLPPPPNFSS